MPDILFFDDDFMEITKLLADGGFSLLEVLYMGMFCGALFVAPIIHILLLLGDLVLELLQRYRYENKLPKQTLKEIFKRRS